MTTIEPATTDDLDTLADLWVDLVASQRQHGTHLLADPNHTPARDILARYVTADDLLVARTETIVGFVMFHLETGMYDQDTTRGVIDNVYVVPPARDQGIGTQLLNAAETALADQGATTTVLSVLAQNDAARRFYERHGYTPHRIEMERTLGSDNDSSTDQE